VDPATLARQVLRGHADRGIDAGVEVRQIGGGPTYDVWIEREVFQPSAYR
jgi:hypothetical protein